MYSDSVFRQAQPDLQIEPDSTFELHDNPQGVILQGVLDLLATNRKETRQ